MSRTVITAPGHKLKADGAPFMQTSEGVWLRQNDAGTAGAGRAVCECGASSDLLGKGSARQAWHREHRAPYLATTEPAPEAGDDLLGGQPDAETQPEPKKRKERTPKPAAPAMDEAAVDILVPCTHNHGDSDKALARCWRRRKAMARQLLSQPTEMDLLTKALLAKLDKVDRATLEAQVFKLVEEANEVAEEPSLEELADVIIVAHTAAALLGYGSSAIQVAVLSKARRNAARSWKAIPGGARHTAEGDGGQGAE